MPRSLQAILLVFAALLAALVLIDRTIPVTNTSQSHFDVLIVLGFPALEDGSVSPEERQRVLEAVREYRAGVASHLILTGGPAHNRFVEADVMAHFAESQGVPVEALIEEPHARNTIQNAIYSVAILRSHGWHSAEVVTSSYHVPRSALIFAHFPIQWRIKSASWPPEYGIGYGLIFAVADGLKADRIRIFGFTPNTFPPMSASQSRSERPE